MYTKKKGMGLNSILIHIQLTFGTSTSNLYFALIFTHPSYMRYEGQKNDNKKGALTNDMLYVIDR